MTKQATQKAKKPKEPKPTGLDNKFCCDSDACKSRRIDVSLKGVEVQKWTKSSSIARACYKNKDLPLDPSTAYRTILQFFSDVSRCYQTNYALSTFSKSCKSYWTYYKKPLLRDLEQENEIKKAKLQEKRSKQLTYSLRRANTAALEYQSTKFVNTAISNELRSQEDDDTRTASSGTAEESGEDAVVETDNIFTTLNQTESIGTRVKKAAVSLHESYRNSEEIGYKNFAIMALGLSSILNLANNNQDLQRSLFEEDEWFNIKAFFYEEYKLQTNVLPVSNLSDIWRTVVELARHNGLLCGLKYVSKLKASEQTSDTKYAYLSIFEHM